MSPKIRVERRITGRAIQDVTARWTAFFQLTDAQKYDLLYTIGDTQ